MYLELLLKDGGIECKFVSLDYFKRDVMQCFSEKSDIGSLLVQLGLAYDYYKYSKGYYRGEQDIAQAEKRGMWK